MTIYADELFIINAVVDYLALLASAKLCAVSVRRWRLLLSALFGAAYGTAAVLPPCAGFLTHPAVVIAAGTVMCVIAFGGCRGILRLTLAFFTVSAVFCGAVMAVSRLLGAEGRIDIRLLAAAFAVCYAVVTVVFKRAAGGGGKTVKVTAAFSGRRITVTALEDTGNSLSDPATGRPVIVAGYDAVRELFSPELRQRLDCLREKGAIAALEAISGADEGRRFRLIPYSAVGVSGGMLLAFRPDLAEVGGKRIDGALIALSPNSVSDGGTYAALTPGVL